MKASALFSVMLFSLIPNLFAQDDDQLEIFNPDTVYKYQGIIPPIEFRYDLTQFVQRPFSDPIPIDDLFMDDRSTIWLRTGMLLSYHYRSFNEIEFDAYFTSFLQEKYIKDSEFDMIRYVLGMAQLSAVAYLAYRHIKKYGFLR
jgi:hypothetical protein